MEFIKTLAELDRSDLPLAGGKGANLGALVKAGLPVPPGFCLTTAAYRRFVTENGLQEPILDLLANVQFDQPAELETVSASIRRLFEQGRMPDDIAVEVCEAYAALDDPAAGTVPVAASTVTGLPVAVRSSATAEDLPDLSFAGQQDTYLNVVGEASLLQAVVRCWASLWTARAVGYRARNHIPQEEVSLAVVVQRMVPSEASGVLFTVNPLTGRRTETVVDATLGLGEALVSGMVEPDNYVVELDGPDGGQIARKTLGAKALSVRGIAGGGTEQVIEQADAERPNDSERPNAERQALPDAQIIELARLGKQAEQYFGGPQDMEWAWAGGKLYVLQSRAVTTLYPLPVLSPAAPLEVFFSFSAWQGMLDPLTPLGQDSFIGLVVGISRYFGSQDALQTQRLLLPAGDRLFVNITGLMRHPVGRNILKMFTSWVDPVSWSIIEPLLQDPRLALNNRPMSLAARLRLVHKLMPLIRNVIYNLLWPVRGRERLERKIEAIQADIRGRLRAATSLAEVVEVAAETPLAGPQIMLPILLPGVIAGQVPLQILLRIAAQVPRGPELVMELTRGLPHNVTTEMDLSLWAVAQTIRADPAALAKLQGSEARELARAYLAGDLPAAAQQSVGQFMQAYGMRGVAEIDVARPRWKEDPTHIFQVLKSYLEIGAEASPAALFQSSQAKASQALEELSAAIRCTPLGGLKVRLVRFLAHRIHELTGLRETPKFYIIRIMGLLRDALLETGQTLAAAGTLEQSEDIFYLHIWELRELVATQSAEVQAEFRRLIAQRRQEFARELRRPRLPHIMLSDGTTYYEGLSAPDTSGDANTLIGTPVSAGIVEGTVHVVIDPHSARLSPGEILVCPATDPAWTPLFLAAGGLVMEVGGMMTHGSVVAREYGIPAVVGVSQVTSRLQTGQRVRVNGTTGQVQILE